MAPRAPNRGGPTSGGSRAPGAGQPRGGMGVAVVGRKLPSQDNNVVAIGVKRRGFGVDGKKIQVVTNYFEVTSSPEELIYHYDVAIKPSEHGLPQRVNYALIYQLQKVIAPEIFTPRAVYDGKKNLYATHELGLGPTRSCEFDVTLPQETTPDRAPRVYKVCVTFAATLNPQVLMNFIQGQASSNDNAVLATLSSLNVAIRMEPMQRMPFNVRSFYTHQNSQQIGGALELWKGYFQSVRPGIERLFVNIDVVTGVMYRSGNLIDVCLDFFGRGTNANLLDPARGFPDRERLRLQRFLSGMRILIKRAGAQPNERPVSRCIRKVSLAGANQLTFRASDGQTMTVADYFRQRNNSPLRYPNVICVQVGTGALVPLEMCTVPPGTIIRKQIPPEKTKDMIDFSVKPPAERLQSIKEGINIFQYGQSEYVRQFGLNVSASPLSIEARLLPAPKLKYGGSNPAKATVTPSHGAWNMQDKTFFRPAAIGDWILMSFDPRFGLDRMKKLADDLIKACETTGMTIAHDPLLKHENPQKKIADCLQAAGRQLMQTKQKPPNLFVIVLPEGGNEIYTAIKHFGDCTRGVPTQCLKSKNCQKANAQFFANVALKINVKLGGINVVPDQTAASALLDPRTPTVVMGADVIHPAPGSEGRPSFASLVASVDSHVARYTAITAVQTRRQEVIVEFQSMAKRALQRYCSYQKEREQVERKPKRIIFYRDGVPEGQFREVYGSELLALKNVCKELDISASITMIIVGKRHHARFFPGPGVGDRSGNCPAGTVVDSDITHPVEFDWFLQSHAGIKGTSRSAHYSVLHDENNFSADSLQSLTFALCHVYARATRSVSLPAPVYYADLVCSRARNHYNPDDDIRIDSSSVDTEQSGMLELFREKFVGLHANQAKLMYFA